MHFANHWLDQSRHRLRSTVTSLCVLLPTLSAISLISPSAQAAERVTPVKLWVAGKVVALKSTAVYDGKETFVPLEALASVGAKGTVTARNNVVRVTLRSGKTENFDYATYRGQPYINLTDIAESVDGKILKPIRSVAGDTVSRFLLPNTTYLLARVTDVHVEGSSLHVGTSFPVPHQARMLNLQNLRGYVDVVGATISKDLHTVSLKSTRYAEKIRFGQHTPDVARVVVELAPGAMLATNATPLRPSSTFIAPLTGGRSQNSTIMESMPRNPRSRTFSASDDELIMPSKMRRNSSQTADEADIPVAPRRKKKAAPFDTSADSGTLDTRRTRNVDNNTQDNETTPTTTATTARKRVIDVERITYRSEDRDTLQVIVSTSSKARAFVHYSEATRQVVIDIPNSQLNLENDSQSDQEVGHSLITGLTASTQRKSPRVTPLTRIKLDASRPVTISVDASTNEIVFEITPQKTAKSQPSAHRRVVVIDAGHGGFDPGAFVAENGAQTSEKSITLAIASKLRRILEAHGAKVLMTRTSDKHVKLEARPALANEVGADLFISIHNNTFKEMNVITGSSTYYHGSSPLSRKLASSVQNRLAPVTGMRNRGAVSDNSLYANGLAVLRETNMTAVLCEVGYINNTKDRQKLLDPQFQSRVANAIYLGIKDYYAPPLISQRKKRRMKKTSFATTTPPFAPYC